MDGLKDTNNIPQVLAFLLGLFSATNVMYVFTIGTTRITFLIVISVICDFYYIFFVENRRIRNPFVDLPVSLQFFHYSIFLSIIPALLFSTQYIFRWFIGIIYVLLLVSILLAINYLSDNMTSIMNGVALGILINVFFVGVEYINYLRGRIYRFELLTKFFPDSRIYVGNTYNAFRAMGLFSEPGHLARFLAIFTLICFGWFLKKNYRFAVLILVSGGVGVALTRSAVIVYFFSALGILIAFYAKNSIERIRLLVILIIALVISFIVLIKTVPYINELTQSVFSGFSDLHNALESNDSSSVIRKKGMQAGIELIKKYPVFGVGWNELTSHMRSEGFYSLEDHVYGTYSGIITLTGQIGYGALFFVYFILSTILTKIREVDFSEKCIGIGLIITFLIFCTTDLNYSDFTAFLLGIIVFLKFESISENSDEQ